MRRATAIGITAGVAAVLVAAGVAAWLFTRTASPEEAAEQYLRALADGDFAAIERMLPDDGVDEAILAQAETAFAGASDHIADYSFAVSDDAPGMRSVRADVQLDGGPGVVGFVLADVGGSWLLSADFLASAEVTTTIGDAVWIGDALVAASVPTGLFPAVYPVAAAPRGLLTGETTVAVTNEHPIHVALDAAISAEATAAAQAELDAYADACAQPASVVPDQCGMRVPWAADLGALSAVAFRIDQHPVVTLDADGRGFAATGGVLVATASGTTRDGAAASFTYRADDWALRGDLAFEGDEMILAVR